MSDKPLKLLIVGAGVSGLTLNQLLVNAGYQVDFIEAFSQKGGRLKFSKNGYSLGACIHHFREPIVLATNYYLRMRSLNVDFSALFERYFIKKGACPTFCNYKSFDTSFCKFQVPISPSAFCDSFSTVPELEVCADAYDFKKLIDSYSCPNLSLNTCLKSAELIENKIKVTIQDSNKVLKTELYDWVFYAALPTSLSQVNLDSKLLAPYDNYFKTMIYHPDSYLVNVVVNDNKEACLKALKPYLQASSNLAFQDFNAGSVEKRYIFNAEEYAVESSANSSDRALVFHCHFSKDITFAQTILFKLLKQKNIFFQYYLFGADPFLGALWADVNMNWKPELLIQSIDHNLPFIMLGGHFGVLPLKLKKQHYLFLPLTDSVSTCYCYAEFVFELFKLKTSKRI